MTHPDQATVPRRISRMLWTTGVMTIAALVALSFWMARHVNELAQENATQLVTAMIAARHSQLSDMTQDYGDWETALDWIVARDDDAVYNNIGTGTTESGFFDTSYIYLPDQTLLYAFEYEGEWSDPSLENRAFAEPFINAIAQVPVLPYETVNGIAVLDGGLVLVSAGRFQNGDVRKDDTPSLPIFITTLSLNDEYLAGIGSDLLLEDLNFVTDPALSGGVPVLSLSGDAIGALTWTPPSPGQEMMRRTLGITALLAALIGLGHYTVGKIAARQTRAFLNEYATARRDPLTRLLNRSGLDDVLVTDRVQFALAQGKLALMFIDMDDFKAINDTHGHDVGDLALKAMAKRLERLARDQDTVARLGGDEFLLVILSNTPHETAVAIKTELAKHANKPVELIPGIVEKIKASVGIAVAPEAGDLRKLMLQADAAMYDEKQRKIGLDGALSRDLSDHVTVPA